MELDFVLPPPTDIFEGVPHMYMKQLEAANHLVELPSEGGESIRISFDQDHFLGKGRTAIALDLKPDNQIVKLYFPNLSDVNYQAVFDEEIEQDKKITHPNIAKIIRSGKAKIGQLSVPFIVRENLPTSLDQEINANKIFSTDQSVGLVANLAEALDHIYASTGAIVTDLTPENIRSSLEKQFWIISELGSTAKNGKDYPPDTDPIYSAPECLDDDTSNQNATPASMVYSLGLICFQTLTGKKLLEDDLIFRHQLNFIEDESLKRNHPLIFTVIQKATQVDPQNRYQTPSEFAQALSTAYSEEQKQQIENTETEDQPQLTNLSGLPDYEILRHIKYVLTYAEKIVVFPDFGPTEKNIVPTGSVTEINTEKHPDWLRLVSGADMGCGMLMAEIPTLKKDGFAADQASLDKLRDALSSDPTISLGRGNHFIDFLTDSEGRVSVLIHTGAFRDQQVELTQIVEQAELDGDWPSATIKYLEKYQEIITSAETNRLAILKVIESVYGPSRISSHNPHNTLEIDNDNQTVRIYKGAVKIDSPNQKMLIPSSMAGEVDLCTLGPSAGKRSLWGFPHGTGRAKARGDESLKQQAVSENIPGLMMPTGQKIAKSEVPNAYRPLARAEKIMEDVGLISFISFEDIKQFRVVGYIGHLKTKSRK